MSNTAEILYSGKLRCRAMHMESGTEITTDAPKDNQGEGSAFSPTDLLAVSLASCILTTMAIVGKRHEIELDGAKAEVIKVMASEPRRVAEVKVKITFARNYDEKTRKLLENTAHSCPVARSLSTELKQELSFVYP